MESKISASIYPYYFFNGATSKASQAGSSIQKEFVRELCQGTYVKPGAMDEAYISFKNS